MKYMIVVTPTHQWLLEVEQIELSRTFSNGDNFFSKRKISKQNWGNPLPQILIRRRRRSLTLSKPLMIFTNSNHPNREENYAFQINPSMLMLS